MKLTNENYYSKEANLEYMSVSQFKDFQECEVMAMAILNGEYVKERNNGMKRGGWVDAYFSNELEKYKQENQDMLNTKTNEFKAPFKNIPAIIETIESDTYFHSFHKGKVQQIYTGVIAGVKVKGKLDFDFGEQMTVDQKVMSDLSSKVWNDKKHRYEDFIEHYGYYIQGGVYQELKRQKLGVKVPHILAITTDDEIPDKALIQIDQEWLDKGLEEFEELAPRYDLIKKGLLEPIGCGNCPMCRKLKRLNHIELYSELFNKVEEYEENNIE